MQLSQKGLELIKKFEGFRAKAYDDLNPNKNITSMSQVEGTLTIGYGHTSGVKVGQTITKERAEQLLKQDTGWAQTTVNQMVKVKLTQNMFDALVSFVYNIGSTNFRKSDLLQYLNTGDYQKAANEFPRWNKSGGKVLQGLVNRRKEEKSLFESGMGSLGKTKVEKTKLPDKIKGIKVLGEIVVDNVKNYTYIYSKTSDKSSILGQAEKNSVYPIAGSVRNWWEIITKDGRRAYIKSKYASRIQ